MRLAKVEIKNFRSIKDITLEVNPSCRVLVGINESGKSNILKALSLLDSNKQSISDDIRFSLEDENHITDSEIRFIFSFDKDEIDQICQNVLKVILCRNSKQDIYIEKRSQRIEFKEFCQLCNEGLYIVNVYKNTKRASYWSLSEDEYQLGSQWAMPSGRAPDEYTVSVGDEEYSLAQFSMINRNDFPGIPGEFLIPATIDSIHEAIGNQIIGVVSNNLPECVYWSYDEKNILPASIPLNSFLSNPNSCMPLKNMFELAGISSIKETVTEEQNRTNGLRNLLNRVAKQTTSHIKGVWQEYKTIQISLTMNGLNIDASITEGYNHFAFSNRSDGFKRFVSFLIMISAKVKVNQLKDTLILIDEPEIGLHPSGARFLRDELIKISEKNSVIYSTHSIFMIDKEAINRHLLVEKKNEVTAITEVNQSNFVDEEVIYNAIGYSIFDNLKENNLLFEGWRDKKFFLEALKYAPQKYKKLKEDFNKIGIAHLQGVSDVGRVCPILDLANRRYLIVSDCDQRAIAEQKKFSDSERWKRWDELSNKANIVTLEDFFTVDHLAKALKKVIQNYAKLSELNVGSLNLRANGGAIHCIEQWIGNTISREEKKKFIDSFKEECISSLTKRAIEVYYYEYLEELLVRLLGK